MQKDGASTGEQNIFTVSQITEKIKVLLENSFPFIWITGEISNFSSPMSGHYYFSLKDENAQISAVMFRGQNRRLTFEPKDGMSIVGLGRISLYKQRGTYQIIFEYLEPKGIGALQIAFEQLKAKLADEGLFELNRKKPLPFLPQKIALITSPTGAVLHDILKISHRRFRNMQFVIVPVKVQGADAIKDVVQAIELVNKFGADVAIIARGGGSLEDLQAFNSEAVARAIAGSTIPVVSAVGHETDYTIADFVSDYRAPTPSAAAEIVVPEKNVLLNQSISLRKSLRYTMMARVKQLKSEMAYLSKHLIDPIRRVQDFKLRCDDITGQLIRGFSILIQQKRERMTWRLQLLERVSPKSRLDGFVEYISHVKNRLNNGIQIINNQKYNKYRILNSSLKALSPLAVLDRGYSITRTIPQKKVVRSHAQVSFGRHLEILLAEGSLEVSVTKKKIPKESGGWNSTLPIPSESSSENRNMYKEKG